MQISMGRSTRIRRCSSMVEQWPEEPRVDSPILSIGTIPDNSLFLTTNYKVFVDEYCTQDYLQSSPILPSSKDGFFTPRRTFAFFKNKITVLS